MKKSFIAVAAIGVFFTACNKSADLQTTEADQQKQAAAKAKPIPAPIEFFAPFVFPEGMVYDAKGERFLVSSIAQGTIGAVTHDGTYSPFIVDGALVSSAGMEIDKTGKRLLVTNARVDGSLAQLAAYDLTTKARLFLVNLAAVANDGAPHLANDVAVDQHGNAYVTDSYAGNIYKVDPSGNATIFYQNTTYTPAPGGFGFNGIEYSNSKGGYLLVAHSAMNSIVKIPISNPAALTTVQFSSPIVSPDGLLLSKNSKELIVVNNTASSSGSKVMSVVSNNSWTSANVTGEYNTAVVYPTTLASDGKTEYVLYSYIHLLGSQPKNSFTIQPLPFNSNNPY